MREMKIVMNYHDSLSSSSSSSCLLERGIKKEACGYIFFSPFYREGFF